MVAKSWTRPRAHQQENGQAEGCTFIRETLPGNTEPSNGCTHTPNAEQTEWKREGRRCVICSLWSSRTGDSNPWGRGRTVVNRRG